MAQKNNFGVERIKIVRGEQYRWINKATFEKQKDKRGWYEEIPLPVMSKNEFVPPEVSNMKTSVSNQVADEAPKKAGRPSKSELNDPNK